MPTPQDASPTAVHLLVRGTVQGVGFRQGMVSVAQGLGVRGWVRNRHDGDVEAVVLGDAASCEAVVRWAHRGPLAARVTGVERRAARPEETSGLDAGFAWRATA